MLGLGVIHVSKRKVPCNNEIVVQSLEHGKDDIMLSTRKHIQMIDLLVMEDLG